MRQAIILERTDHKEVDQLISLFLEDEGKRVVKVRGVKKIVSKNSPHLEPGTIVDADLIEGKDISYLVRALPRVQFQSFYASPQKGFAAQYVCALVNALIKEREGNKELFETVLWAFVQIDAAQFPLSLMPFIILELFGAVGHAPELAQCVKTGEPRSYDMVLVPAYGGICTQESVKREDVTKIQLKKRDIDMLHKFHERNFAEIDALHQKTDAIDAFLHDYALYHINIQLPKWKRY